MPKFCINCGASMDEGIKFCKACGTKNEDAATQSAQASPPPQPAAYEPPRAASPPPAAASYTAAPSYSTVSDAAPPKGSKYAPMSTLGYFGWLLLMSLPLIGLVTMLLLAFGKGGSVNRRNLARAMLLFIVIGIVAAIVTAITLGPLLSQGIDMNWEFHE